MRVCGDSDEVLALEKGIQGSLMRLNQAIKSIRMDLARAGDGWKDEGYCEAERFISSIMESVTRHMDDIADLLTALREYEEVLRGAESGSAGGQSVGFGAAATGAMAMVRADVVAADKAGEYNKTLQDFCESNGYVENADFSDFDPRVAYDLAKAVVDAKIDFPDLEVKYLGSIDHQVKGLHDTVEAAQFDFYRQNGFDEGLAQQMAKQYADDFIRNSKLDNTERTYAWSLRTGSPLLDKYDGVAVNNVYAKDYTSFKSKKQANETAKWSPIGCGSPKAVADHELGHEIDNLLGASNDSIINDLYSNMMKDNKAEDVLSGYSRKNVKEFIAEAYSEYRNNPNPREISRSVYNRLIELRNQKSSKKVEIK